MKRQFFCKVFMLGLLGISNAPLVSHQLSTCWEVEQLSRNVIEDIENTVLSITSLSSEEETVENIVVSCQDLHKRMTERVGILDETSKLNQGPAGDLAKLYLEDLLIYAYQFSVDPQLNTMFHSPFLKKAFQRALLFPLIVNRNDNNQGGGKIEATISATWGGSDGIQIDAELSGGVFDGKGNYIEAKAEHNFNSGEGRASVSAGTISEKD